MQRIDTGTPPRALVDAINRSATFSEISANPTVRRALWTQQNGRCAYCERVLRDPSRDDHHTRIEHFHPQRTATWTADCGRESGVTSAAKADIAWSNLLLCCDGNEKAGRNFTCDKLKGNTDVCGDFCNPHRWPTEALLSVGRDGRVQPRSGLPASAGQVIEDVLNLNAEALVAARRRVLDARLAAINKIRTARKGLTPRMRQNMAENLRRDAATQEFGAVLISIAERLTAST